jgi:uncharacterized SAM-binding protein YcdF (DUF218 family)
MRRLMLWSLIPVLALGAYLASVARRIHLESTTDEAAPADLILVLGAAKYRGRPSPVYKARLDHAFELRRRGLAPRIMTTGGAGGDPVFTEGGVGRSYLISLGVPAEAIIVEQEGATTAQSIAAAAEIMRRMGLHSCIIVSDGYHIFRAKRMLAAQGFRVYGSPRPDSLTSGLRRWWLYLRQAMGYLLWRLGLSY